MDSFVIKSERKWKLNNSAEATICVDAFFPWRNEDDLNL